ncbi:hypothetical protein V1264_009521 [Littorina saxatilis]|uniref:Protein kinase domain-containing protein n=2 Tax=Littorina saxatilis TaxID=31220 RepID=A0AAN9ARX8_9CAEN
MVSGVSYLHSQNIVHRDIKDENIIINEHFNIKLIDFGAAAYMLPGKVFGTFCGTIEYCSPEVLMGNKYRGPELELWSMGITLYTLIFGENPFFNVEETLEGVLKPPTQVSRALMFLITWLLHPDPLCRATIGDVERNAWVNQTVDASQYQWDRVLPNTEFHGNTACDNRQDTPEHKDSGDSRVNLTPKRNDSLSDTSDHSGHAEKEINSSPGSLHHNRTSCKASRDRIEDVVTGFNRLLQMHDSLDSDN